MAEESEKRFHAVMDKLFQAPSPSNSNSKSARATVSTSVPAGGLWRGRKRPHTTSAMLAVVDSKSKGGVIELQNASGAMVPSPMCRPWDREDLLKRLATFKSMTWFAKPEVVSAINCARRGWVNVDMDIIACESCGARLLFSTPSSWAQQQVEKAASVFSLKLNNGHKLLCPWVDNACDEKLAQFPPASPADLVDDYKKRCASLLQLLELPVISPTAFNYMRSPLLEHFLKSPSNLENVYKFDNVSVRGFADESEEVSPDLYYQPQKLISLCGWEPRLLPYIVDCKNQHDQSVKDGARPDSSITASAHNASITVYSSSGASENMEANEDPTTGSEQYDHTSVVLDCRLCGARVGLWAFCTTPRPAEFVRLIGHAELNNENKIACQTEYTTASTAKSDTTSSNRSPLNLTIAGGPPPAEQNFRPTISLPVVGQNLRTRFSSAFESVDGDHQQFKGLSQGKKEHLRLEQKTHEDAHNISSSNGSIEAVGDDIMRTASPATNEPHSTTADQLENTDGLQTPGHPLDISRSYLGKDSKQVSSTKSMQFDPLKQHRHFCPWIVASGKSAPGWKQTLSALERQKEFVYPSSTTQASSSLIEVEDPVGSVKKLLTPPSAKRKKPTHGSS